MGADIQENGGLDGSWNMGHLGNQTPGAFKKQCFSTTNPEAVFQE